MTEIDYGIKRVWFYKPQLHWFGWRTLLPVYIGHDEWARYTLGFGWSITGQVVFATKKCNEQDCIDGVESYKKFLREEMPETLTYRD